MAGTLRRIVLFGSGFVLVVFVVVVVNQTAQVVHLVETAYPGLGQIVLWILLAAYATMLVVPIVLILRLPAPLRAPAHIDTPEFNKHLKRLRQRLCRNASLADLPLETAEELETALRKLDSEANEIIRRTASAVFVTTAISQNGKLDGLLVLSAQTRLVWRIARLYWQRPTLRDMAYLYGNVAGTVFVASEIEDLNLEEQIAPLVTAAVGGTMGAIPGFQAVVSILTASLLTGSANAYLTLRVGLIARRYCSFLVTEDRRRIRRAAALEAAGMLITVAQKNATRITKGVLTGCGRPVTHTFRAVSKRATDLGSAVYFSGRDVAGTLGQAVADAFSWLRPSSTQQSEP